MFDVNLICAPLFIFVLVTADRPAVDLSGTSGDVSSLRSGTLKIDFPIGVVSLMYPSLRVYTRPTVTYPFFYIIITRYEDP